MKPRPALSAALVLPAALFSAGLARAATTAVYNPATGRVTVQGTAVSQTVTVTAPAAGTFSFNTNNPLFGTVTLDVQCAATLSVKIGDTILGELPSTWSLYGGSYVVAGSQTTGTVSESSFPGFPAYPTDPGFVATLGQATADFPASQYPNGAALQTTVVYTAPGNPVGVVLKGILVARAAYTCGGTPVVTLGTLGTQPPLDFTQISSSDPPYTTAVTLLPAVPATTPWATGLLAMMLVAGAAVGRVQERNRLRAFSCR